MNTLSIIGQNLIARFHSDEEGASMVEYGLLIAFIALIAVVGVVALGDKLLLFFNNMAGRLPTGG